MEVVSFDGGLNTKANAQYVGGNQSVILHNADVYDGTLKSSNGHVNTTTNVGPYFKEFNGKYVSEQTPASFVEYDRKLFITTDSETKYTEDGILFRTLGTNPPDPEKNIVATELVWPGTPSISSGTYLVPGAYEYRIVQGDTVYKADFDSSFSAEQFIELSFNVVGYVGTTELYRFVEDSYYLVDSVVGDGVLIDGNTLDILASSMQLNSQYSFSNDNVLRSVISSFWHDNALYSLVYRYISCGDECISFTMYIIKTVNGVSTIQTLPDVYPNRDWRFVNGASFFSLNNELYLGVYTYALNVGGNTGSYLYNLNISKLDGNAWVSMHNKVYSTSNTTNHRQLVIVSVSDTIAYIVSPYSGTYVKYNGGGFIDGGILPILPYVVDSTIYKGKLYNIQYYSDNGNEYLYVTKFNGDVHKYKLGSRNTEDTFVFNLPQIPRNESTANAFAITPVTYASDDNLIFTGDKEVVVLNSVSGSITRLQIPTLTLPSYRSSYFVCIKDYTIYISYSPDYTYIPSSISAPADDNIVYIYAVDISISSAIGSVLTKPALDGTFNYLYTFSDSDGSNETSISSANQVTLDKTSAVLNFDNIDTTALTHINVYRNGGTNNADSYYRLIDRLEIATLEDYIDSKQYSELIGAITPPEDVNNEARQDLKYLSYHRGRLWAAGQYDSIGIEYWSNELNEEWVDENGVPWSLDAVNYEPNKLYFSGLGEPTLWNNTDYLLFPEAITGIGSTPNGLVVFSATKTYAVLGTTFNEFSIITISDNSGCLSHQSIQSYNGELIYVSDVGINSTNGGNVTKLSRPLLDMNVQAPRYSAIADDRYYVDNGDSILEYDFRVSKLFKTMSNSYINGMSNTNGKLQLNVNGKLANAFEGAQTELHYKSGKITSGAINMLKEFIHVWIRYIGTFEFNIIIDNKIVNTITLESNEEITHRYSLPKTNNKGYSIQFELIGTGNVLGIEFNHNLRKD